MSAIPASQEEYDDVHSLVDRLLDENEALRVHLERVLARLDEISHGEHTDESDHASDPQHPQQPEYPRRTRPPEFQSPEYQSSQYPSSEYQSNQYQSNDARSHSPVAGVVEKLFFADMERRVRRNEETLADLLTTMRALTGTR